MQPPLTVVIPTLNEAAVIQRTIAAALSRAAARPRVLVVDGGSADGTAALAARAGARVLRAAGGRAAQLNAGAAAAGAGTLLFLHADTLLPEGYDAEVARVLGGGGRGRGRGRGRRPVVAGAFRLRVDGEGWALRFVERVVNWRSRWLELPYGDQALFLGRAVFDRAGGYPDMPFMEDYEMSRRLARMGELRMSGRAVVTSARRWESLGVWRTAAINQCVVFGYHVGVPVPVLARWYRGALTAALERRARAAAARRSGGGSSAAHIPRARANGADALRS